MCNVATCFNLKDSSQGQWYEIHKILCCWTEDDPLRSKHFTTLKIQHILVMLMSLYLFYYKSDTLGWQTKIIEPVVWSIRWSCPDRITEETYEYSRLSI